MSLNLLLWVEFIILICGTIFAWYQWFLVFKKDQKACSLENCGSPFKSKCFYGAIFFTLALAINIMSIYVL